MTSHIRNVTEMPIPAPQQYKPSLGQLMSDPNPNLDVEWCECQDCRRPTRMTGTKLCDRCWHEQRDQM